MTDLKSIKSRNFKQVLIDALINDENIDDLFYDLKLAVQGNIATVKPDQADSDKIAEELLDLWEWV